MAHKERSVTEFIVVHCSASNFGNAEIVDSWHKQRGWNGIGYHYVILNGRRASGSKYDEAADGLVEKGREIDAVGAHEKTMNSKSVGVCLIGEHWFTWRQFEALANLLRDITKIFPGAKIVGHCDTRGGREQGKTCPNFAVRNFLCKTM